MSARLDSSTPEVSSASRIASAVACHHLRCSYLRMSLRSVSVPYLIALRDLCMSKLIQVSGSLSLLLLRAVLRSVDGLVLLELVDFAARENVSAADAAERGPFGIRDCLTVRGPEAAWRPDPEAPGVS